MLVALALVIGIVSGLRAMAAPAAVGWAARLGWLDLSCTWLSFLGSALVPWRLTMLAPGELVTDQLPTTPGRTVPIHFVARVVAGGQPGAAIGATLLVVMALP